MNDSKIRLNASVDMALLIEDKTIFVSVYSFRKLNGALERY